ncbi:MAG: hypothetical protein ACK47B_00040 [Armatimonadota bacterium]
MQEQVGQAEAVVGEYLQRIRQGKLQATYGLTAPEFRRRTPLKVHVRFSRLLLRSLQRYPEPVVTDRRIGIDPASPHVKLTYRVGPEWKAAPLIFYVVPIGDKWYVSSIHFDAGKHSKIERT